MITSHWDKIKEAALTVYNWVRDNWPLLLGISPVHLTAVVLIIRNWDTIRDFFTSLPGEDNRLVCRMSPTAIAEPFRRGPMGKGRIQYCN